MRCKVAASTCWQHSWTGCTDDFNPPITPPHLHPDTVDMKVVALREINSTQLLSWTWHFGCKGQDRFVQNVYLTLKRFSTLCWWSETWTARNGASLLRGVYFNQIGVEIEKSHWNLLSTWSFLNAKNYYTHKNLKSSQTHHLIFKFDALRSGWKPESAFWQAAIFETSFQIAGSRLQKDSTGSDE